MKEEINAIMHGYTERKNIIMIVSTSLLSASMTAFLEFGDLYVAHGIIFTMHPDWQVK